MEIGCIAVVPAGAWSPSGTHPKTLSHTDSKAVTPINAAAQKFQVLIRCSLSDNSLTLSRSSWPGFVPGNRHIADANQNAAEAQPAITAAVSIKDFMTPRIVVARIARPVPACKL